MSSPHRHSGRFAQITAQGVYGDKETTLARFKENYTTRLTDEMKARLVLENDEASPHICSYVCIGIRWHWLLDVLQCGWAVAYLQWIEHTHRSESISRTSHLDIIWTSTCSLIITTIGSTWVEIVFQFPSPYIHISTYFMYSQVFILYQSSSGSSSLPGSAKVSSPNSIYRIRAPEPSQSWRSGHTLTGVQSCLTSCQLTWIWWSRWDLQSISPPYNYQLLFPV